MSHAQQTKTVGLFEEKVGEMMGHTAWHGDLPGVDAEALLREHVDYTFLLRQGEKPDHFYLSYVTNGTYFTHIPFSIDYLSKKWFYRNTTGHFGSTLTSFVPEIMHRESEDCLPLVKFAKV